MFLEGGNGLQTQAEAGKNGGCGLIVVHEIKNGKKKYTDAEGGYGPFIHFYDPKIAGISYRKAEDVLVMDNCRLQLIAEGVHQDWIDFVKKAGEKSVALARVLPVIAVDREMIRLHQERLPADAVDLSGVKAIMEVMESKLGKYISTDKPPIVISFSPSQLMEAYRNTNDEKTKINRDKKPFNIGSITKFLLEIQPPSGSRLKTEGSGCAQVARFLRQINAEFTAISKSNSDRNALQGFPTNFLRVCLIFFGQILFVNILNVMDNYYMRKRLQQV